MIKPFSICLCLVAMLFFACDDEAPQYRDPSTMEDAQKQKSPPMTDPLLIEIKDMEAKAKLDSVIDRGVGLRLLRAYQEYYNKNPKDAVGMKYLFEAARVADALGKYQKAIDLLVNYHDGVADANKKAEAAYMVAFIYDAHMHQDAKAIEFYNRVINLYPNSIWAEQAKSALHLVGKSDEELLNFLKEKDKKPS